MDFDSNYKFLGEVDVTSLIETISSLSDEWLEDTEVSDRYRTHRETEIIRLKWPTDLGVFESATKTANWDKFGYLVEPVIDIISEIYGEGYPTRVMFNNLNPDATISRHTDNGSLLTQIHRIHLPILTNDDVHFVINDERIIMPVGKLCEINNQRYHSVVNKGTTGRVHLLIDYYAPKTNIL